MSLPSELAARDSDRPEVSIVVPVYNEEAGLAAFWTRLAPVLASLAGSAEVVFVDDGSSDGTLAQLLSLRHLDRRVRIVSLSRNFGKEIALTAGLDHAGGDAVIPIDADLQHPPEVIGELVARWRDGSDIVIALRRDRATDGLLRRAASSLFHRVFARLTTVPVTRDAGDFRLMSRRGSRGAAPAPRAHPVHERTLRLGRLPPDHRVLRHRASGSKADRSMASGGCGGWRSTASRRSARCRSRYGASSACCSRSRRLPTALI